jgi:hypothetical protein
VDHSTSTRQPFRLCEQKPREPASETVYNIIRRRSSQYLAHQGAVKFARRETKRSRNKLVCFLTVLILIDGPKEGFLKIVMNMCLLISYQVMSQTQRTTWLW